MAVIGIDMEHSLSENRAYQMGKLSDMSCF